MKALDLDPEYASAYAGLSWTHLQSWQFLWSTDRESFERARELGERAIALDNTLADAYRLLGQIICRRRSTTARLRRPSALSHSLRTTPTATRHWPRYWVVGQGGGKRRLIRHAMRLNPRYPFFYLWTLGHAYYLLERRQEALEAFGRIVQLNPEFVPAHAYRALLLSELGGMKEAREAWDKASHLSPGAAVPALRERLPYKRPADLDRSLNGTHRFMALR